MAVVGGRLSTVGSVVPIQSYATGWGAPRCQCNRRALLELKLLVASGHQAVLTAVLKRSISNFRVPTRYGPSYYTYSYHHHDCAKESHVINAVPLYVQKEVHMNSGRGIKSIL